MEAQKNRSSYGCQKTMDPCAVFKDSGIHVFIRGVYTCIQIVVRDIPARKQVEDALSLEKQRMESLFSINQTIKNPESGIISEIVDDAIRLTGSTIGHLVTLNDDESVMTMQYWSKSAHVSYTVHEKPLYTAWKITGCGEKQSGSAGL